MPQSSSLFGPASGPTRLTWIRVNDLPDFVYFNHQIHVSQGVGCDLPRPGGQDAADVPGQLAADGVLPRLPSGAREVPPAARARSSTWTTRSRRARPSSSSGLSLKTGIQDSERHAHDELLGVPPLGHCRATLMTPMNLADIRIAARRPRRPHLLAQPRRAGRHPGVPGLRRPRVPGAGLRVHRPGGPPASS